MASHVVLKDQLLEMGFDEKVIEGALYLLKDKATLESVIEAIENGTAEEMAKSLNNKSDNGENSENQGESSQITSEDLEAKKKALEDKIKQRRLELEEQEKEKERQRELQRRKDGKCMSKVKEELDKLQRENFMENLKREKAEAKAARDAILRQIEQDKAERRNRNQNLSGGTPTPKPVIQASNASKEGKAKLAIRLLDGSQLIQDFDAKEVLSSVRAFIVTQKNINYNITLAMPPTPAFSEEDMQKPLHALGLVPNARLQVVKRN